MGVADPARVGVVGHSWGGFDAAYLATHSNVFAAAVAGAAITNLVSNYGNHHWSSGIAETDHIETGQQRMEVPIYEDLQAYIRNSAVFNVHNMKTPLLLEVGDNDGTVHWHQGVELYNIARRAKKDVVMLAYGGEDHGLRRKANQIDYQKRIHPVVRSLPEERTGGAVDHDGLSFIDREQELKRAKAMKKGTSMAIVRRRRVRRKLDRLRLHPAGAAGAEGVEASRHRALLRLRRPGGDGDGGVRGVGVAGFYLGPVGNDENGRRVQTELRRVAWTLAPIVREAATRYAVILVEKRSGDRSVMWDATRGCTSMRRRCLTTCSPARESFTSMASIRGSIAAATAAARWD